MSRTTLSETLRNSFRNIISGILGYHLWLSISYLVPAQRTLELPLCFYGNDCSGIINAPEHVRVTLYGSRKTLHVLDTNTLAVHIDTKTLTYGTQSITLSEDLMLLPRTVHVAHSIPSNITVTYHKRDEEKAPA